MPRLLAALLATLLALPACAAWPEKPIRFIVPSAAGGSPDVLMRVLVNELSKQMGVAFIVDNKPGASFTIGTAEIARWRGEEASTAGDSFLALFDGPARAVHCALAVRDRLAPLGIEVRAGVHTGEIERTDANVRGIAVHFGARVSQAAGPGEVLVSGTTYDLVEGSGLRFEDRGEHELKGLDRPRRLFAALSGPA